MGSIKGKKIFGRVDAFPLDHPTGKSWKVYLERMKKIRFRVPPSCLEFCGHLSSIHWSFLEYSNRMLSYNKEKFIQFFFVNFYGKLVSLWWMAQGDNQQKPIKELDLIDIDWHNWKLHNFQNISTDTITHCTVIPYEIFVFCIR